MPTESNGVAMAMGRPTLKWDAGDVGRVLPGGCSSVWSPFSLSKGDDVLRAVCLSHSLALLLLKRVSCF